MHHQQSLLQPCPQISRCLANSMRTALLGANLLQRERRFAPSPQVREIIRVAPLARRLHLPPHSNSRNNDRR